ncbi:MAG TPA: hypothetical protein VEW07_06295 [Solirubrobacterales bacterium]|nr:hypothetical protein [Solirubrobacterales bacterium]
MNTRPSYLDHCRLSQEAKENSLLGVIVVGCIGIIWAIGWPS